MDFFSTYLPYLMKNMAKLHFIFHFFPYFQLSQKFTKPSKIATFDNNTFHNYLQFSKAPALFLTSKILVPCSTFKRN